VFTCCFDLFTANTTVKSDREIVIVIIRSVSKSYAIGYSADLAGLGSEAGCIVPSVSYGSFFSALVAGDIARVIVCVVTLLIHTCGVGYDH
jgi:hypothetical protein